MSLVVEEGERLVYRGRPMLECLGVHTRLGDVSDVEEPIVTLNSMGEWSYPPREEIRESLMSGEGEKNYVYTYGSRLFGEENQIDGFVIPLLEEHPQSGRGTAVTWSPGRDGRNVEEAPGIVSFDFKLREGELHVTAVIRNNDVFFGWPANICQTKMLQEYVADELGVESGKIGTLSCSAHIYEDNLSHVREVLGIGD